MKKSLSGKNGEIRIHRNRFGIPVIEAESSVDLAFGLGWIHALDRQLQTLLTRLALEGRLAEHLRGSERLAAMDISVRRILLLPDPDEEIANLDPDIEEQLRAYANGFNYYLSKHKPVYELKLLGYHPEPWRIEHSLLTAKSFGYFGSVNFQDDNEKFLIQMIQQGFDEGRIRELFPYLKGPFNRELIEKIKLEGSPVPENIKWAGILPRFRASNNWAVSGELTRSGKPILCGDLHQELNQIPCIWYEVVMELPDNKLIGATIPGVPWMIIGRTKFTAWSPTSSLMSTMDYRIEHCRNGKYRRGQEWKEFKVREELIKVRKKESIRIKIYENEKGILEGDPAEEGYYLSRIWSVQRKSISNDFNVLAKLPEATTVEEAMDLFKRMDASSFNWVIADRDGNIGYQMSGRMHRKSEGKDGSVALSAWDRRYELDEFVSKDDLPSAYNPSESFITTANNDLNHLGRVPVISIPDSSARAGRAAQLLGEGKLFDVEDMKRMQYDLYSAKAERFMRIIRPLLPGTKNGKILKNWDCIYDSRSKGATLFESVYRELIAVVFGDGGLGREVITFMGGCSLLLLVFTSRMDEILLSDNSSWFGERDRDVIYREAIRVGLKVKAAPFIRTRRITFFHLLFGGIVPSIVGYDYGPVGLPGGRDALFIARTYGGNNRTGATGPVYRLIADMSEECLYTNMPGGPSDRRFSRWYKSDMRNWFKGVYKKLE